MSKARMNAKQLRDVRKDMLRARAQVERHALARSTQRLAGELSPGALVRSLVPSRLSSKQPSDWLLDGVGLLRRYPYLVSAASTVFSGLHRRRRLWRIGASLLLGWALARGNRGKNRSDEHA